MHAAGACTARGLGRRGCVAHPRMRARMSSGVYFVAAPRGRACVPLPALRAQLSLVSGRG